MRSLDELLSKDSAWPQVESWISEASNDVEVERSERSRGMETLHLLQVTTRSPMGAVALETAVVMVDRRWVRVLGAGGNEMTASLASWNGLGGDCEVEPMEGALVVAYDAVGGFFALNGGAFDGDPGSVFYFAPDTLEWESLERGYTDFLQWLFSGDLATFYEGLRWKRWEEDVLEASPGQGFHLYPPPFTKQGQPVEGAARRLVPMAELWGHYRSCASQLADLPEGAEIRFKAEP